MPRNVYVNKSRRERCEPSPGRLTKRITPRTRACTKQRNLIKRGPRPGLGPDQGLGPGLGPGPGLCLGLGPCKTSSFTSPSGREACCGILDYPACVNCYNSIPLQMELRQVEDSPSNCLAYAKLSCLFNWQCSRENNPFLRTLRGVCVSLTSFALQIRNVYC